jgi:hypothetical protein
MFSDLFGDLPAERRPSIEHREQDPLEAKRRIVGLANALERVQQSALSVSMPSDGGQSMMMNS